VANAEGCADISIDALQAAAFIDARFDLVFPNSERVVGNLDKARMRLVCKAVSVELWKSGA